MTQLQARLAEEMAANPEPATQKKRGRIQAGRGQASQGLIPRDNLPASLTPLVGRQQEMGEIKTRLLNPGCRFLTVLGPGGSGKTHLALEVARSCLANFPQGVFLVTLNPLQSTAAILPAIGKALNLPRGTDRNPQTQLVNYLRQKRLLLLLDGCEHLLNGAGILAALLRQAPGLKILATSRTRLRIVGEHLYPLSGMHCPPETATPDAILGADAVQLFVSGLQRRQPDYQPDPEDSHHLLQICRQVQGMPLGILLAASWGATFSVAEISSHISRSQDPVTADWPDVPLRQCSLQATFDHTWELLSERQQAIFKGLSTFRGRFSQEAARVVSGATHQELRALVDHFLVENKITGWYQLHALLRQYGREKLADSPKTECEVLERHSTHYLATLKQLGTKLKNARQETALSAIDLEHSNIRTAWDWATSQGLAEKIGRVLEILCLYYDLSLRYAEGQSACLLAIDGLPVRPEASHIRLLKAHLLVWQSRFTRLQGRHDLAQRQRMDCQSLLEGPGLTDGDGLFERALLAWESGEAVQESDIDQACQHYQDSLAAFQELGETWWTVKVKLKLALCETKLEEFDTAQDLLGQCLANLPMYGGKQGLATALELKSYLYVHRGQLGKAMQSMQEAVEVNRSLGNPKTSARCFNTLGLMMGWHGRFSDALDLLNQSRPLYQELGDTSSLALVQCCLGMMYTLMGQVQKAQPWTYQSLTQAHRLGDRRVAGGSLLTLGWIALHQDNTHKAIEQLQGSVAEYRQGQHPEELGWALAALGQAHLARGETRAGRKHLHESLRTGTEIEDSMTLCLALGPCALWLGGQGELVRAIALYNLARQHPAIGKSEWFETVYGDPIMASAEALPAEAVQTAQEWGRGMDLWETVEELLGELAQK